MAKNIAEVNKGPLWSPIRQAVCIPFRFLTGASEATGVVIPGSGPGVSTVSRTSSTVYVLTIPAVRTAASLAVPTAYEMAYGETNVAQYVLSMVFAAGTVAGTTTVTITFSAAPADGSQCRGYIWANASDVN